MLGMRSGKYVGQKGNTLSRLIGNERHSNDVQAVFIDKEMSSLKFVPPHVRNHLRQDVDILKLFTF
jgi:hypothetical protein